MYEFETQKQTSIFSQVISQMGADSDSTESLATSVVDYLWDNIDVEGNANPMALIRFFRTVTYDALSPDLQASVCKSFDPEPNQNANCLTLLATRGMKSEWNSRQLSAGHRCIPLSGAGIIERAPMIAQLIKQLGIDVASIVDPGPSAFLQPEKKKYQSFFVEHAKGSINIPAQDFVKKYQVKSVTGFGSLLPTGDMFAVILFSRVQLSQEGATNFARLAAGVETAINQISSGKKKSAKILVADLPAGASRILRLMQDRHELVFAETVERAINAAEQNYFDLTVCGTDFDDSRMFDLLREMKRDPLVRVKPFVCLRQSASELIKDNFSLIQLAATTAGASCYIDSIEMGDLELRSALESFLPEEIWKPTVT